MPLPAYLTPEPAVYELNAVGDQTVKLRSGDRNSSCDRAWCAVMTASDTLMNSITNGVGDSSPISRSVGVGVGVGVLGDPALRESLQSYLYLV